MRKLTSLLTTDFNRCYMCGRWVGNGGREIHHIFGGSDRKNSDKYELVVPLCRYCHNLPPDGVHFNAENMLRLKQAGQRAFEHQYSHSFFLEVFKRDYT